MDIQTFILICLEIIGIVLALIGVIVGTIKGRHAIKLTGGGIIETSTTYLLIAAYLYLISFALRFWVSLIGETWIRVMGSIVMFGMGICFFMMFWRLGEYMKHLEELTEGE